MAQYDLPAIIDHILNKTGSEKLSIIAHSTGCFVVLITLSTRTEYNDKVNLVSLMAPFVYTQNLNAPLTTAFTVLGASPVSQQIFYFLSFLVLKIFLIVVAF